MCYPTGITRKSATLLIAAVQFLHGFGTFLSVSVTMQNTSNIAYFGVVVASAMNMWLALVLCVGVNMNRPYLILIWLSWAMVVLVLFVVCVPLIALYSYVIKEHFKGANFAATYIMYALSFFLHCLFIHVVYGYHQELVLSKLDSTDVENIHPQTDSPDTENGFTVSTHKTNQINTCD